MQHNKTILIIAVSLSLFSCSQKIAYTSDIHNAHKFSEEKLKKVQFYTSNEITLVQTKQDGDVIIENGALVVRNNKDLEKITIPKGTKCILEQIIDDNKMIFSFEYGDGKILLFGNNGSGCFSLMAKDGWLNGAGTIPYANKNYMTSNGNVFLTIKAKQIKKSRTKERIVHGRSI